METTFERDLDGVLGIPRSASGEDVRNAYRRRAFETHPDRGAGSGSEFLAVAEAYRVLSDPLRRSEYDAAHPVPAPLATLHPPPTVAAPAAPATDPPSPDVVPQPGPPPAPVADAARSLFEYLTDVARCMILKGSAPEEVIASLRREGCPESVASALERDLRAALHPAPPPRRPPRRVAIRVGVTAAVALAAVVAVAMVRPAADPERAPAPAAGPAASPEPMPAAAARSATPAQPEGPRPPATRPLPTRPHATRREPPAAVAAASVSLDAEKAAVERDWRALAAESASLQEERARIDAATVGPDTAPSDAAALRRDQAAYNARLDSARGRERALQRRTAELNRKLEAYNARVMEARGGLR